jgi:hypothetical protein
MYFFFHLAIGVILGLLLADLLYDGRWVLPCALGAILPDLIDKPVGYLLPQIYFGYGRVLFHTLLVLALVLATGLLLWKYRGTPVILGVAAGIFLHQVMDTMWNEAAGWLFPFLGTPRIWRGHPPGYLLTLLERDLLNPSEWLMAGVLLAGLLLWVKRDRVTAMAREHAGSLGPVLGTGGILFGILGAILLFSGVIGKMTSPFGRFRLSGFLVLALSCALVALLLWRWGKGLRALSPE